MRLELDESEKTALKWMFQQTAPVFSFKTTDPEVSTIRKLVKKRLVRVSEIILHPQNPHLRVSCFKITRKGKRYYERIYL